MILKILILEEFFVDNGVLYQKPPGVANLPETSTGAGPSVGSATNYSNSYAYNNQTAGGSSNPISRKHNSSQQQNASDNSKTIENNFLDENTHICCGLCGEIVSYESLINEHLPMFHPDVMSEDFLDLEEIPYDVILTIFFVVFLYFNSPIIKIFIMQCLNEFNSRQKFFFFI